MDPSNVSPAGPAARRLGPLGTLGLAAWFGLVAGLLEVLTKLLATTIGRSGHLYQMSRHFVWLVPLTNLLVFLGLGVVMAVLVRLGPRFGRWLSVRLLGALALLPALLVAFPEIYTAALFIVALGIVARIAPSLERRTRGFRRLVMLSFPALILAVVATAGTLLGGDWLKQARESARPLPPRGAPNVLLVVLDTVRADHLSVYGYSRPTTPTLELIAAQGLRFDAARSTSPWTLPSHASMFTGRLPHELQVGWLAPVGRRFPTLAGYLGSRGYATAGFVANTLYCSSETGLADGFTHYVDYDLPQMDAFLMARLTDRALTGFFQLSGWLRARFGSETLAPLESFIARYVFSGARKDASGINRDFLGWLAARRQPERPFFAFLNYMDAHAPYFPPSPRDFQFGAPPQEPTDMMVIQDWEAVDKPALDSRLKTLASDCYDNCIHYLDGQLYALFSGLARRGLLEQTLVIVTADHGESFGEHDLYLHGDSLYRPEIQVPLLIMQSGTRPITGVVGEVVSLRDLPATVVDLLGLAQGARFPGHSLVRALHTPAVSELAAPNPVDPNRGRSPARRGPLTALTSGNYSYIVCNGQEKLFDEQADPGQRRDLAGDPAMAPVLRRLRSALDRARRPGDPG